MIQRRRGSTSIIFRSRCLAMSWRARRADSQICPLKKKKQFKQPCPPRSSLDGLGFSRSPLLSVYADMSNSCEEYYDDTKSMLELVFAPATVECGASRNWLAASDEEVVEATLGELSRLFPADIVPGVTPRKFAVVRTPRFVFKKQSSVQRPL
jgi:hypothetical protein